MKLVILGSGTSTGVPMVGCSCPVCRSTDPQDKRTRTSLMVISQGKTIIVDTSTDLRQQALREGISRIDAVLFTHFHADHVNGIDDLRGFHFIHRNIVPCYGESATMEAIIDRFPYIFTGREVDGYAPLMEPYSIHGPFDLFGCRVIPVPLVHGKLPATGYRFGNAAYLTDCSGIPEESLDLLAGLDLLIIDALRYSPHENHFNIDQALDAIRTIRPKQAVLTHLTHEVSHRESSRLPEGCSFACDGMSFDL